MQDLNIVATTNQVLSDMVEDGTLKNIIREQLVSTIKDITESSMRSYSDFGKALSEKINEVILTSASSIELPEYNKFVSDVVVECFDTILQEQAKPQLQELVTSELGCIDSSVITCAQIMEKIRTIYEIDDYENSQEVSVSFEDDGDGWFKLVVENESECDKVTIRGTTFYKDEQHSYIAYMESGSWKPDSSNSKYTFGTNIRGELCKYLYRLYCAKSKLDLSDSYNFEGFTVGGYY